MAGILDFRIVMEQWTQAGMFDVLLPLLLVFAIIYAILHQAKILGGMKSIDAVVACIIAFFVVVNRYVAELFVPIFSQAGLAIIILVAFALIMGLFFKLEDTPSGIRWVLVIFGMGMFVWFLSRMAETFGIWTLPIGTWLWKNSALIVVLIMVVAVIAGVLIGDKGEKKHAPTAYIPVQAAPQAHP